MIKQICNLTKLQLKNLYGLNVLRHTKDKKQKGIKIALLCTYMFLILIACGYVGGLTFAYSYLGLFEMIPAYLIMISSLIILFFAIFKAGSVIFQKNAYDILASLPLPQSAIVISRFIRMYIENLMIAVIVMFPAMLICGVMQRPAVSFYIIGLLVTIVIPLLPITIATFLGALVTAVSSRMKHKSLVSAVLSMALFMVLMLGLSRVSGMEDEFTIEMFKNLSEIVLKLISRIYPPAVWMGNAMLTGNFLQVFACIIGMLGVFVLVIAIVSVNYYRISHRLYSTNAKHDYKMETLKKNSILGALYKREAKRYFSSTVYVTNTIVGPVMALVFAIMLLVIDTGLIEQELGMAIDVTGFAPFLLAAILGMMPTTCTTISMEGKQWWIVKSLPIKAKDLLDAKILLYFTLTAPFYVISEILFIIGLKPTLMEFIWSLVIPIIMTGFSAVFGITVNLKLPVFDWENEVTVVKQSATAFFGGIGGFVLMLLCIVPVIFVPAEYKDVLKIILCVIVLGITFLLYRKNNKIKLSEIG